MDVVKIRKDIGFTNVSNRDSDFDDDEQENTLNTLNLQSQPNVENPLRESPRISYQELPGLRHETKDVLKQLHKNIQSLEDLSGRLGFMMTEIRTLIRR